MTSRAAKYCLYLIVAGLVLACFGCGGPNPYNKRQFVLDVNLAGQSIAGDGEVILDVRRFTIDSRFDSKGIVYRKGELEYEADFYNEYLVAPEVMITEQTRMWLSRTGLFKKVLEPGSLLEPTHTMEANITALYADFTTESAPAAVMEASFFVIAHEPSEGTIVYANDYKASASLAGRTPEDIIRGLNQCLEQVLSDLQQAIQTESK